MQYTVIRKGDAAHVLVEADDVDVEAVASALFFNFFQRQPDGDDVTVAAFPYESVDYVVSDEAEGFRGN